MKTITINLILAIILIPVLAYSQDANSVTKKGSTLVSGNISVHSTSKQRVGSVASVDLKSFTMNLTPKAGYFIMDKLATGIEVIFISASTQFGTLEKVTTTGILVSPFIRYYVGKGFFVEGSTGIGSQNTKGADLLIGFAGSDLKYSIFGVKVGAGYTLFLDNRIAIEPIISYSRSWETRKQSTKGNDKLVLLSGTPTGNKLIVNDILFGVGFTAFF